MNDSYEKGRAEGGVRSVLPEGRDFGQTRWAESNRGDFAHKKTQNGSHIFPSYSSITVNNLILVQLYG
jgi:hypothetical protein